MMRLLGDGRQAAVYDRHVGPFVFDLRPDTVDYDAVHETWVEDVYRLGELPLEAEQCEGQLRPQRPYVVDIGAHIGAVAIWCALRGADVHCYEASKKNREILARHAERARVDIHIWHEVVLANTNVTIHDIPGTGMSGVSPVYGDDFAVGLSAAIERCFDSGVSDSRQITLLKIDVEGSEWDIFQDVVADSPDALAAVKHIAVETHPTDPGTYGGTLALLSRTHHVDAFGPYENGGMIHATRY
jgi:FkbM family methyltransferase